MITIYKSKSDILPEQELIILNDVYFNKKTVELLDDRADDIIQEIDRAVRIGSYRIQSRFHNVILDIDRLSTGCKTVLNIMYNPDKIFCIKECGENAIDLIYGLDTGLVFSDYPTISFEMDKVQVVSNGEILAMDDYEQLKEWWRYEQ
ncbi:MAG: DUF4869 domain-containing protein [Eubacterium sp.]|nr:DUF4869 domain-containing protein [Eubacterium sp.]